MVFGLTKTRLKSHLQAVNGGSKLSVQDTVKPVNSSDDSCSNNSSPGSEDICSDGSEPSNSPSNYRTDVVNQADPAHRQAPQHQDSSTTQNEHQSNSQPPIAICGMALRAPSGVKTPAQLWDFLLAGGDARKKVPASRYNVSAFHDPSGKPGTVISEYGYFIDEDIGGLDTSFFSMPRLEVERTDPQQRMMLETVRECFEDAGETNWRSKPIGCYMGSLGEDWCEMFARETQNYGPYRFSGYGDWALSNRVSYEMDLQGPSMTVRTACSASLVALHNACIAISRGDCSSAIVGGANLIMSPGVTMAMAEQNVLSKDGSCKTFSADANGYARGEAIAAIFVKKLDDAIRDGNPIRAVIRGTASNFDGKTPGMTVPSTRAQEILMRRAYQTAGITDFTKTGFVECHGTGTPIGDPIEAKAVAKVFGNPDGMYITSIKPNFGHTEGASGVLSVIKAVLALENKTVPPNIKFTRPNPDIPFQTANLMVPLKPTPWPQGRLERVSINSFGIGGANAHAVIDSAVTAFSNAAAVPQTLPSSDLASDPEFEESHLLLFSANSKTALATMIDQYREFIATQLPNLKDLSYTLANRREHLPYRAFGIASHGKLESVSPVTKTSDIPTTVMVFTGQGAQWPQMGRELLDSNAIFRDSIQRLDSHLQALDHLSPSWTIERELRKIAKRSQVNKAEYSQPLCTAVQIGLVDVLASLGIKPGAVVGHSSGEIAAAYAAGALDAQAAITVAWYRGAVMSSQIQPGAMAAIGMSWDETSKYLLPNTTVACDNSPKSVTISGDAAVVDTVLGKIRSSNPGVLARKLAVEKAYHSHHMKEIGSLYLSLIESRITASRPAIPFFSSVTGDLSTDDVDLGSRYWQRNLESTVLFNSAVSSILKHPIGKSAAFLEIGPHSALAGPLQQIFTGNQGRSQPAYASVMIRNQNCADSLLSALGKLYAMQVPIDLKAALPGDKCLTNLPRYPYDHSENYWHESRLSKEWRCRTHSHHDLLGVRLVETTDFEPIWRNMLHLNTVPWVRDHKVGDDVVFPFAAYVAMAGEAIRQITEIDEKIRLRHIIVSTALVVQEEKPTEMITTLRPHRLTDSLDSKWWEFAIYSHNGRSWTKHCIGQVMAQKERLGPSKIPRNLPRKLESRKWFDILRQNGLDLGPKFCNLGEISAGTVDKESQAEVLNNSRLKHEKYHIHPAVVDSALQLIGVALTNGLARKFKNRLPTSCDEFEISRTATNFIAGAFSTPSINSAVANVCGEQDGCVVLRVTNMKLSAVDGSESMKMTDTHATARLVWKPDLDFLNVQHLIEPFTSFSEHSNTFERLYQSILAQTRKQMLSITTQKPHWKFYDRWVNEELSSLKKPDHDVSSNRQRPDEAESLIQSLVATPMFCIASTMQSICENLEALCSGDVASWEDLMPIETVNEVHKLLDDPYIIPFIQALAHNNPNLHILEIGSWSDNPSTAILNELVLSNGTQICAKYTFATKQLTPDENKLSNYTFLNYTTLDIDEDFSAQGFDDVQYDLVISNNAVCSSGDTVASLLNIKKIMKPNGRLLLREIDPVAKGIGYILGTQRRWWSGSQDDRSTKLFSDRSIWETEFQKAQYDLQAFMPSATNRFNTVMIVKPSVGQEVSKRVTLLSGDQAIFRDVILSELYSQGYMVDFCTLHDAPIADQDIISILDLGTPFFEHIDQSTFGVFKDFVQKIGDSRLLWVTQSSQIECQNPRFAQSVGIARAIRSEMSVDFGTCEVDNIDKSAAQIVRVLAKFQKRDPNDTLRPDLEYSINRNTINIGRFYPFALSEELKISEVDDGAKLEIAIPGRPTTLHWANSQPLPGLDPNQVEVEVHAVGLNFRDVLIAMNLVQLPRGRVLGCEGAGIVRRVGPQVKTLKVGDRVGLVKDDMFATKVHASEMHCVKLPDNLSFNEAATMLVPYTTAMYSLMDVGGIEEGMSILIHSACGGVGLAAIQLARVAKAEIFVTVGSEEKVKYLTDTFGIPRNRIFNSRDESFVDDVMRETQDVGVDLVLNSLSGELLHATWKCVAPFGKLIEIGKRDLIGSGKLDMSVFLANRSYCCVDLDAVFVKKPAMASRLLTKTMHYFESGKITPIDPIEVFDGANPYDAFRFMQPGTHIGRICVAIRNVEGRSNVEAVSTARQRTLVLKDSASYLLIGGLGGLGRAISIWMVEHGARHLIYLSRSAGTGPDDKMFVEELNSMGCEVQLFQGSVTNAADVTKVIQEAKRPLRGILQMSMVSRDRNFAQMTFEDWNAVVQPKVQGTWNLHDATKDLNLDFFMLFSSLSGIIGQPGQTNYAGANTFLDAFVQYRKSLGLPATAVDIGAMGDVGFLVRDKDAVKQVMQKVTASGFKVLKEQELLDALTAAMTRPKIGIKNEESELVGENGNSERKVWQFTDPNNFVMGLASATPLTDPNNRAVWRKDRRMAIYHNTSSNSDSEMTTVSEASRLKTYIAGAKADPSILQTTDCSHFLAVQIGKRLCALLLKPEEGLNTSLSLADLGMDSLVAIELRTWWKQTFGFDISVLEMLGMGTLEALGQHAAEGLLRATASNFE